MITVGTFRRVVKKDGTMLFKPAFRDHDFLEDISYLIHSDLGTKWDISDIKKTAHGFHIKLKGVNNNYEAGFFIDEEFALPDELVEGRTVDLVIGEDVLDHNDKVIGKVRSLSQTPSYIILEIERESGETELVPFTEEFFEEDGNRIRLKRREQ